MAEKNIKAQFLWKGLLVNALILVPFLILLISHGAGYQEISLRGSGIYCAVEPCPCSFNSEIVGRGIEAGYDCPINTYGIGLYSCLIIFTFAVSLLHGLLQPKNIRGTFYFIISSIIFWIFSWSVVTMVFHIPVVLDEPQSGDYVILQSAFELFFRTYENFIGQLFFLGFVAGLAAVSGIAGAGVSLIVKRTYEFLRGIRK